MTIDIVRGEPPLVGIPTFNTLEKEDPKAKIRVLGVVFSTQNKEILCQWESLCISGTSLEAQQGHFTGNRTFMVSSMYCCIHELGGC